VEVDPLASMRCWAIELELGGRTFDVPALTAVDWWPVLTSADLTEILDFVVSTPEDPFNLDDLLLDGDLTQTELQTALTDALETASGRSRHVTFVLASVANQFWASLNGALARRGFRWEGQPLGAALDAVYAELTSRLDKDELTKFEALLADESLTQPGKKRKPARAVVDEFESMAGPRPTTGAVASAGQSGNARPKTQPRLRRPRQDGPSGAPRRPREPRAGSGLAASS
jgi:hypothetical protein